jgi:hypothetical protein
LGNLGVFKPGGKVYPIIQTRRMGLPNRRGFAAGNLLKDENGQTVEIANEHPNKSIDSEGDDRGIIVLFKRKST